MSTDVVAPERLRPGQPAPDLIVPVVGGGEFSLADAHPRTFTMIVFFRGLHCPACHAQLRELDRRMTELAGRGIDLIAVSAERRERAEQIVRDWRLQHVTVGYGLTEPAMRAWGLFVSRGRGPSEPDVFNEPAVVLIDADGRVYYASILSMPVGRPRLDDLLRGIDRWLESDYPARGEA